MNVTTCRTKAHTGEELLHKIMDGVAHTREHPEIIQRVVNSCLERARLFIENCGKNFEQL
jgi:hypothetical protein